MRRERHDAAGWPAAASAAPLVALVGYTNAGQVHPVLGADRTADAAASDLLFMTLDPLVRRARLGPASGRCCWWTPWASSRSSRTRLVDAFRATLEEVVAADLLLHVVDASAEDARGARGGRGGGPRRRSGPRTAADRGPEQGGPHAASPGAAPPEPRPGSLLVSARTGEGLPSPGTRARMRRLDLAAAPRPPALRGRGSPGHRARSTRRAGCWRTRHGGDSVRLDGRAAGAARSSGTGSSCVEGAAPASSCGARSWLRCRVRPAARAPPVPRRHDYVFPAPDRASSDPPRGRQHRQGLARPHGGRPVRGPRRPSSKLAWPQPEPAARRDRPGLRAPASWDGCAEAGGRVRRGALARPAEYVPALMGAGGRRAPAQQRGGGARASIQRGPGGAPADAGLRRRVAEVKLQLTERRVAEARTRRWRRGHRRGRCEPYRQALRGGARGGGPAPRSWPTCWRRRGTAARPPTCSRPTPRATARCSLRLGELLIGAGASTSGPSRACRRILARDPRDAEALRRAREVPRPIEFSQMPEEYRRIPARRRIIARRPGRPDLGQGRRPRPAAAGEPKVAVDISGSWARDTSSACWPWTSWTCTRTTPSSPAPLVRRGDLARAAARVLDLLRGSAQARRRLPSTWPAPTSHYDAAAARRGGRAHGA